MITSDKAPSEHALSRDLWDEKEGPGLSMPQESLWIHIIRLGRHALRLSTALIIIVFLLLLVTAANHVNSFIIGKIEVPKALSEIGYSSGVVGYQVRDEIYRVIHARPGARGTVPRGRTPRMIETATPAVEIPGDVPAITIPETGISLQSFIGYLESFMPEAWRHVVSGEIIKLGEQSSQFSMRLRLNDSLVFTGTSNGSDAVEVLVRKSAPILVETMYRDRLARNSQCLELITW